MAVLGGSTTFINKFLAGNLHAIAANSPKLPEATLIEMQFAQLLNTEHQNVPISILQRVNALIGYLDEHDTDAARQSVSFYKQEASVDAASLREYEAAQKKYVENSKKLNEQKNELLNGKNTNPSKKEEIEKLKREAKNLGDTKEKLESNCDVLTRNLKNTKEKVDNAIRTYVGIVPTNAQTPRPN